MSDVTTVDPPVSAAPEPINLHKLLDEVYAEIKGTLTDLPANSGNADRFLAPRLGFEPTQGEIRALISVALEPLGDLRVSAYKALTLWVVGRRTQKALLKAGDLDTGQIERAAQYLPKLLETTTAMEDELNGYATGSSSDRKRLIMLIGEHLLPSRTMLNAAQIIAPKLADFARAVNSGEIAEVLPSSSREDIGLLTAAYRGGDTAQRKACQPCLCALLLLEVINGDLKAWEVLSRSGFAGAELIGARKALSDKLGHDKLAYDFMFERLQRQQEAALKAERKSLAAGVRRIQGNLFSAHLKLVGVQRQANASKANDGVARMNPEQLGRLLAQCSADDAKQAPASRDQAERTERRDLVRDALRGVDRPAPVKVPDDAAVAGQVRRTRILLGVAALLLVACGVFYANLLTQPGPPDVRVPLTELNAEMPLQDAMVIGGLMYAKVGQAAWDGMSREERITRLKELGGEAVGRGCGKVYLTDERGRHLATWTKDGGVEFPKVEKASAT